MTQVTTDQQYNNAIKSSREIFLKKTKDYGTSWRVYRTISIADQIYIKAKRIRNIQEKDVQKVESDNLEQELTIGLENVKAGIKTATTVAEVSLAAGTAMSEENESLDEDPLDMDSSADV